MVFRKKISIVLCLCMLVLASMPVLAAECSHTVQNITKDPVAGKSLDFSTHEIVRVTKYICASCHKEVRIYREVIGSAKHSIVYDDLGHAGVSLHYFLRRCTECGYSEKISTICDYNEWGFHAKP